MPRLHRQGSRQRGDVRFPFEIAHDYPGGLSSEVRTYSIAELDLSTTTFDLTPSTKSRSEKHTHSTVGVGKWPGYDAAKRAAKQKEQTPVTTTSPSAIHLSPADVAALREDIKNGGYTAKELAAKYHVHHSTVNYHRKALIEQGVIVSNPVKPVAKKPKVTGALSPYAVILEHLSRQITKAAHPDMSAAEWTSLHAITSAAIATIAVDPANGFSIN